MKFHHNTLKKAAKFGITLSASTAKEGHTVAVKDGVVLASGPVATAVLEEAIAKLQGPKVVKARKAPVRKARDEEEEGDDEEETEEEEGEEEGDDEEETEEGDAGKSVVKKKYKQKYRPFKMTCGDDLSQLISAHVAVKDEDTGKMKIDEAKLIRFAKANGVWDPRYATLNPGMKRMNIANRLRGKVRRDKHEVVWAS